MSVKKLLSFVLFLFSTQSAFGALPPYYQTSKEIKTILESAAVAAALGSGGVIELIQKTKDGYLIKTKQCTLNVQINYQASQEHIVGPVHFTIELGQKYCQS